MGNGRRAEQASVTELAPTPRQLEVLRARCEAGSRKEAGAVLGISAETVRWHLARLYESCGCVDDAQAAYRHYEALSRTEAA
jgi:DNA-binding NarL/FixJ family response regulator